MVFVYSPADTQTRIAAGLGWIADCIIGSSRTLVFVRETCYVRTQAHVQLIVAGIYWCVGGEKSWGYLLPPSVVPPELFISQWDGHMEFFFEFFSHP